MPSSSTSSDENYEEKEINILLVDDHPMIMMGLSYVLTDDHPHWHICERCANGEAALSVLRSSKEKIDIVILDIAMPKLSGLMLAEIIKNDFPNIRVIIYSMYTSADKIDKLKKSSVLGFLDKGCDDEELIDAVYAVLKNDVFYSKTIKLLQPMIDELYAMGITPRERETLFYLNKGLLSKEIASEMQIAKSTVDDHLKSLRRKFNVGNQIELLNKAKDYGLLDDPTID